MSECPKHLIAKLSDDMTDEEFDEFNSWLCKEYHEISGGRNLWDDISMIGEAIAEFEEEEDG